MHVVTTRRQYTDRSGVTKTYRAHLLRRSFREGGKVKNETLGNLSALPDAAVEAVKAVLRGQVLTPAGSPGEAVEIVASLPHGHVAAVVTAARRLGFPELLGPPCRLRDLAFALLVARVVRPRSKLATTRWWADTTWPPTWGWPTRPPTRCTRRWTGCSAAKTPSRPRWPPGTCARARWRCST